MEKDIVPTTEKEQYTLEDKDYLLIEAIRNLASEIRLLRRTI